MKRIGLRLITAALSAAIMVTTILPGTQLKAGADTIDTGNEITAELEHIKAQIDSVIDAAVKNFESSVEHYTNNNIDIITKTISVDRYIDLGAIQGRQSKHNGKAIFIGKRLYFFYIFP